MNPIGINGDPKSTRSLIKNRALYAVQSCRNCFALSQRRQSSVSLSPVLHEVNPPRGADSTTVNKLGMGRRDQIQRRSPGDGLGGEGSQRRFEGIDFITELFTAFPHRGVLQLAVLLQHPQRFLYPAKIGNNSKGWIGGVLPGDGLTRCPHRRGYCGRPEILGGAIGLGLAAVVYTDWLMSHCLTQTDTILLSSGDLPWLG